MWDVTYGMRSLQKMLVQDYILEFTGWTLKMAKAISDDGLTIIGKGVNPDGKEEAWCTLTPLTKQLDIAAVSKYSITCLTGGFRQQAMFEKLFH